jgi:hypothetical protein
MAGAQPHHTVATARQRRVMGDEDKRHAALTVLCEQHVDDLLAGGFIEVTGWFIGDENRRFRGECPGQRHALLLSAGELCWIVMQSFAESDRAKFVRGASKSIRTTGEFKRDRDVFKCRHGGYQVKRLEDDADMAAAKSCQVVLAEAIERHAVHHHFATIGTLQSRHDHEQGRFAGAGCADQAECLPGADPQADILEDVHARGALAEREVDA